MDDGTTAAADSTIVNPPTCPIQTDMKSAPAARFLHHYLDYRRLQHRRHRLSRHWQD
jgi:hypothetical protein